MHEKATVFSIKCLRYFIFFSTKKSLFFIKKLTVSKKKSYHFHDKECSVSHEKYRIFVLINSHRKVFIFPQKVSGFAPTFVRFHDKKWQVSLQRVANFSQKLLSLLAWKSDCILNKMWPLFRQNLSALKKVTSLLQKNSRFLWFSHKKYPIFYLKSLLSHQNFTFSR